MRLAQTETDAATETEIAVPLYDDQRNDDARKEEEEANEGETSVGESVFILSASHSPFWRCFTSSLSRILHYLYEK